jgi:hypothetical protein
VCDPHPNRYGDRAAMLASQSVSVAKTFDALLDDSRIEAIWLPLPIEPHRRSPSARCGPASTSFARNPRPARWRTVAR